MQPVTNSNGEKGFYDESTGFISIANMQKVTNDKGERGYYHTSAGFIPAPSKDLPQPATEPPPQKTTGLQDFATGAKRGLASIVTGIGQRTGLVPQSDVDMVLNEMQKERQGEGFAGKAGEFAGGMAPYALIPGGQATLAARLAVNAATGAGAGFLEPTRSGESATKNAITGMAIGAGGAGVVEGAGKLLQPTGKWLYTHALKMPISEKWKKTIPGQEFTKRETAVNTGFNERIVPNSYGRSQADKTISDIHGQVDTIIDDLTKQGKNETDVSEILQGLRKTKGQALGSSDSNQAQGIINKIEEEVKAKGTRQVFVDGKWQPWDKKFESSVKYNSATKELEDIPSQIKKERYVLNPRQLQTVKQQFADEVNWDASKELTGVNGLFNERARKAIAHQSMVLLEGMHPEIGALNKKQGAYIALRQAIEHSVARYDNLNASGIQAVILALKNIGLAGLEIVSGTPTVKAKLAFAIDSGAKKMKVSPKFTAGITQSVTKDQGGQE